MKVLEHSQFITIPNGNSQVVVPFTPQQGRVIGCCVYHNNPNNAINPGIVRLKLTTDSGEEISPLADIRHYRDREAEYYAGLKPLNFDTAGKTYVVTVIADAAFTADFKANFMLIYDNVTDGQNC